MFAFRKSCTGVIELAQPTRPARCFVSREHERAIFGDARYGTCNNEILQVAPRSERALVSPALASSLREKLRDFSRPSQPFLMPSRGTCASI